jgi:ribonuclease Z
MSVILREVDPGLIIEEKDFTITAFPVTHRGPDCYGYLFEEHARRPFLPDKADALGVPSGPLRRDLVEGKTVTLPEGRQVHPDEVLGEEKPGTRLALTGDTGGTIDLVDTCAGVDTLITEATYLHTEAEMAGKFAHLTARQAGELARDAQVGNLIMTHISRRYREREVLEEAKAFFTNSWVARDFDVFQVKRSECVKVSGG